MTGDLTFSIVINTLDRASYLKETMASLAGLRHHEFEVVVVNGPSSDGTAELLAKWAGKIKLRSCEVANLSMSRNIGIAAAAGDIVAFIDDDAVPHPDWLKELARPYADARVAAVGGFTIDNTGTRFQVRKTICDRYGNAHSVSPFFDERPLCFPGTPYYPSLLGTNSSFRRDVLLEIGGFDHAFAYLLDETDVCLRIVDAGHEIHYAPRALVFHQFANSRVRSHRRLPTTLYPSAVSKGYFIQTHGARSDLKRAGAELEGYRQEIHRANVWLRDNGEIGADHCASLDQDLAWGLNKGAEQARLSAGRVTGDLGGVEEGAFKPYVAENGLAIVLVSQSFPPANEAGIARWTSMMARGLSARGHTVHVITKASQNASVKFENGHWLRAILPDNQAGAMVAAELDIPDALGAWAAAVRKEISALQSFGVDVVSFPIWDLEGAGLLGAVSPPVVMSLHTTYAMAQPFKAEWKERLLYHHFAVRRVIAHEAHLLSTMPMILANSQAIVDDLEKTYELAFRDRARIVPHGTEDPLLASSARKSMRNEGGFLVGYVGRFEQRKGFDLAAAAIARFLKAVPHARAVFVGDTLDANSRRAFEEAGAAYLLTEERVSFAGLVSRSELDDYFARFDAVVMPSRYESFGLVAIEAAAAGAVVIAGSAGGLAEVVRHGETGWLVPFDGAEAEAILSHLKMLAGNAGLRRKMSQAARKLYETEYTVEAMVAQVEAVYREAISRRRQDVD
jgi:glycosyltransferase involved in cell wall biosynthesis/GT2 family glycosyltransferase